MHAFNAPLMIGAALGGFHVGDMLVMLVAFIVLMFFVKKFAWGPVVNMMQKREEHVANEIDIAEKNRAAAEASAKEAAEQLKQTKQEAQKMIEDAKDAGKRQEQDIIESAREEAERIKKSAQEEIRNEKERAVQALQDQVSSLSILIASKVIEKEISEQDQQQLIEEYIKEVGEER